MIAVIPMAGRGSRFAAQGETLPKPLIPVRGRPMYSWAMDSLPVSAIRRVVFIALEEHAMQHPLEADIRSRYAALDPQIVLLREVTQGQACTVLTAEAWIAGEEPLLIYNADTFCRTTLTATIAGGCDAVLGVARVPGSHWSFARLGPDGRVVETAEKRRISDWASTGLYWFRRAGDFVLAAREMIAANDRVNGEFYVAPVFNRLIAAGADVRIDPATEFWPLGTPEELARFEQDYPR